MTAYSIDRTHRMTCYADGSAPTAVCTVCWDWALWKKTPRADLFPYINLLTGIGNKSKS